MRSQRFLYERNTWIAHFTERPGGSICNSYEYTQEGSNDLTAGIWGMIEKDTPYANLTVGSDTDLFTLM
jgi:hypothetical protein